MNVASILEYAKKSVGMKDGAESSKQAVKWLVNRIIELDEQLSEIENQLNQRYMEIPHAKKHTCNLRNRGKHSIRNPCRNG